jgi:hypothetical protein
MRSTPSTEISVKTIVDKRGPASEVTSKASGRPAWVAATNEERFLASCKNIGEADVRKKLAAGGYGERRAMWASEWLEKLEYGKSDETKAEENSARLVNVPGSRRSPLIAGASLLIVTVALLIVAYGLI